MAREPSTSPGLTLWQGEHQLELTKAPDRFTARVRPGVHAEAFAAAHALVHAGRAERQDLELFAVGAEARDTAMKEVRNSPEVEFASHVYQIEGDPSSSLYLTDEITVQFRPDLSDMAIEALTEASGLTMLREVPGMVRTYIYRVTSQASENPIKIANRLHAAEGVIVAEPNVVVPTQSFFTPDDPLYPAQWHLNHHGGQGLELNSHIDAERAWTITTGDREVVVAIADLDPCDQDHADLQGPGKIVAPRDLEPLPDAYSGNHGTACAAVAVAEANGHGVVGVAPGCALMPIRINSQLDDSSIEALFDWAVSHGAAVISCSWGSTLRQFPLSIRKRRALEQAATLGRGGRGCVILFAAGNANRPVNGTVDEHGWTDGVTGGPTRWHNGFAAHPDVIAVAACTSLTRKAAYSAWGPEIALCAPSNNAHPQFAAQFTFPRIFGSLPGLGVVTACSPRTRRCTQSDYTYSFGGTSSACPTVAGVAALVLSANPALTAREVRVILESTADKIQDPSSDPQLGHALGSYDADGHSQWFGYGKVNAFRAVSGAVRRRADGRPTTVLRQTLEPALPIPGGSGVRDTAYFAEEASLAALALEVVIEHPSRGDLRLTLTAPSGAKVILHDRVGGMTRDLRRRFDLATTPGLSALVGQPLQGNWALQVEDLIGGGGGRWLSWTIIATAYLATQPVEEALTLVDTVGSVIPDQQPDGIVRTLPVGIASTIREVQVTLDITHSYIGDLLITLVSPRGTQVVLHGRAGQATNNLVATYSSATTPGLQQLRGEPTQGDWRLLVSDLEAQDVGKLNHWRLKLSYAPVERARQTAARLEANEGATGSLADLTRIKGIGSVVESRLRQAGILSFGQLVALSPEAIAALLTGLNGISPERIRRQEWIAQAERLAAQEPSPEDAGQPAQPSLAEAEGPQAAVEAMLPLHYETFTLRVTLDAEGRVKQTRVVHVQDGKDQTWGGWHSGNLISFVEQQAGLANAEPHQLLPADAEPPIEPSMPESPPPAWLAALAHSADATVVAEPPSLAQPPNEEPELPPGLELTITRVTASLLPDESSEPALSSPCLRGEVTFRLSGELGDLLACRHMPYLLGLAAHDLADGATTALVEAQRLIEPLDEPAPDPQRPDSFSISCVGSLDFDPPEQPGSYQLHGTITVPALNANATMAGRIFRVSSNQSEQL